MSGGAPAGPPPGGEWRRWWARYRGRTVGTVLGLLVALAIKQWGILWTLFVSLTVLCGYVVGRYLDGDEGGIGDWIDRFLPPGRR